eukprot:1183128-Rhodomonas_salina.2
MKWSEQSRFERVLLVMAAVVMCVSMPMLDPRCRCRVFLDANATMLIAIVVCGIIIIIVIIITLGGCFLHSDFSTDPPPEEQLHPRNRAHTHTLADA